MQKGETVMNLTEVMVGEDHVIKEIVSGDEEFKRRLFSFGCYSGEYVTVVSHKRGSYVISIKDARYNIDAELAKAIKVF